MALNKIKTEAIDTIVGSVANGAVIERGTNANGEYVKFADGTLICTLNIEASLAVTTAYGTGLYGSRNWIYPAAFTNEPVMSSSARTSVNLLAATPLDLAGTSIKVSCNWAFLDPIGTNHTGTAKMTFIAIGRWK